MIRLKTQKVTGLPSFYAFKAQRLGCSAEESYVLEHPSSAGAESAGGGQVSLGVWMSRTSTATALSSGALEANRTQASQFLEASFSEYCDAPRGRITVIALVTARQKATQPTRHPWSYFKFRM